ncbi:MAG TPA: EF-hand domain-containing protein [Pirellulales bacterium]|jgi:hypothetical protein|nr:EF-hand domain-containing protein [Pirellulales bacterium]
MATRILAAALVVGLAIPALAAKKDKTDKTAAPDPQVQQNLDAACNAIFKKVDKNNDRKLSEGEFKSALNLIEQYAASLPLPPTSGKRMNKAASTLNAPTAGLPDLSKGKHLAQDEFKTLFPSLVAEAQSALAQQQAQAAAANMNAKKKRGY